MKSVIVNESSSAIKRIAKEKLRGSWLKLLMVGILFFILTCGLGSFPFIIIERLAQFTFLEDIWFSLVSLSFLLGLISFMLSFFRKKKIEIGAALFSGFRCCFKVFCLDFIINLFVFLQFLLLIVPGFIAILNYSQTFYILADNPKKGVMQCIKESKKMMNGNKLRYFCLKLSFIGWTLLSLVLFSLSLLFFELFEQNVNVILFIDPIIIILFISYMLIIIYMFMAETAFYELASGHFKTNQTKIETKHFAEYEFENLETTKTDREEFEDLSEAQSCKTEPKPAETAICKEAETAICKEEEAYKPTDSPLSSEEEKNQNDS